MNSLENSITNLKNIGEARAAAFDKVGVSTIGQLIQYYPRAYQNRSATLTLAEIKNRMNDGIFEPCSSILTVSCEPQERLIRRGMSILKIKAFDETGTCEITYFNQRYLKDHFHVGATFRFWGRFEYERSKIQISSPVWEPYIEGKKLAPIVPVYPLTKGLTQKIVAGSVIDAIKTAGSELCEYLPEEILSSLSLATYFYAVKNIHMPESVEALETAKRRLIFDEIFLTSVSLFLSGGKGSVPSSVKINNINVDMLLNLLPYTLTKAQIRSLDEILNDMAGESAMNRILVGDVGSGKTIVAACAAYAVLNNGYSAFLMVPTEILATQHYKDLYDLFVNLGFECLLLTGSTSAKERRGIISKLSEKEKPVFLIGTHALISPDISPSNLGLVIIDEQHRFGVKQRAALAEKTDGIHTLVMSATPIPRTLSLIAYGNLDVSRIDELPAGRQPIDTFVVNEGYRSRLNGFISKQIEEGHQVYVVCPSVEENKENKKISEDPLEMSNINVYEDAIHDDDNPPLKAAVEYADELQNIMPRHKVGFVHGKMKAADKEQVMKDFCSGKIDVLVSTTVIEVGVNVPNATLMIVENAERFGTSQLHQLRGRVGRGKAKSYFILVSDSKSLKARERLSVIKKSNNGYDIAEADLRQRGPGDLLSDNGAIRQHGQTSLLIAGNCGDVKLISLATGAAERVLSDDPELNKKENEGIRKKVLDIIKRNQNTIN